jgi:GDPmannose 4,6-dehydratase
MIINADPSDWVVATGETHSIREMCEVVFSYLNMDYKDYVIQNPKYMRPEELPYLRGDSSRIRATLGWSPEYTFETLLKEMVDDYLQKNTNKL